MAIDKDVLDQLLAGRDPQELFAKDGLLDEPTVTTFDVEEWTW